MDIKEKIRTLAVKERYSFSDLCDIMEVLRSEEGCPWDREQSHESVRMALLEETYEAAEAIDDKNPELLCEELGDMLFQIVFHAEIERERGVFDISDVIDGVSAKMVHRHPHVFSDVVAENSDKVLSNWEKIKNDEKSRDSAASRLKSVPKTLPALMKAEKVGSRAAKVGFDFPDADSAREKIYEELLELEGAENDADRLEEAGDLLFAVVNYLRKLGINSEQALGYATDKFVSRFEKTETELTKNGGKMQDFSLSEMDNAWKRVKMNKNN